MSEQPAEKDQAMRQAEDAYEQELGATQDHEAQRKPSPPVANPAEDKDTGIVPE